MVQSTQLCMGVSHTGWNGIDISHSTHTLMSRVTLDNIGWMGIQGTSADRTSVVATTVNNTEWIGIAFIGSTHSMFVQS